jgi:hypothetical protein
VYSATVRTGGCAYGTMHSPTPIHGMCALLPVAYICSFAEDLQNDGRDRAQLEDLYDALRALDVLRRLYARQEVAASRCISRRGMRIGLVGVIHLDPLMSSSA